MDLSAELCADRIRGWEKTFHKRVSLRDRNAFGSDDFEFMADLADRKWVRLEIWDIAGNGAFTQPVWLQTK